MRVRNVMVSFLTAATFLMAETAQERLKSATAVFNEVMETPDKGIPEELVGKAHCIVLIPGMKSGALVVGGKFGRGYAMCRKQSGVGWGAPAAVRVEGGSFGLQIGGQATDVVLLIMNDRGIGRDPRRRSGTSAWKLSEAGRRPGAWPAPGARWI